MKSSRLSDTLRDLIPMIQDARKELGFEVTDRLQLSLTSENDMLANILSTHQTMIEKETLTTMIDGVSSEEKILELDEGIQVEIRMRK
jgi:hypothetical protein